ncbi:MAG: GNAT family N-acetyltransferase [Candidatus Hodarchaeota archaeon]
MRIEIRTSNPSDVDTITDMEKQCFETYLQYGPSILFNLLNSGKYVSLTAGMIHEKQFSVIGSAVGEKDQNKKELGRIVLIIVDPRYQRKKIGTKLLSALEEKMIAFYGIKSFELQVHYKNEAAICFYQKNGYKIDKQLNNYYNRKEHAFLMQK